MKYGEKIEKYKHIKPYKIIYFEITITVSIKNMKKILNLLHTHLGIRFRKYFQI